VVRVALVRLSIVSLSLYIALFLQLGTSMRFAGDLLRLAVYSVYLSILPTVLWIAIYSGASIFMRKTSLNKFDFLKHIVSDLIFSGFFLIGIF
jgi:hypothetical protein